MKKKEFKSDFIFLLNSKGYDTTDSHKIESALQKLIRHMKNRDGATEWKEDDLENAVCFYNEYKKQGTFNRESYYNRNR